MNIEDMNDSDKKTSASKPFKSNGGSEPQTAKEQVIILRTEVRQVDETVGKLVVTVDANRKEAKDDSKALLAMMTANRKEAKDDFKTLLAMMTANREEFLAGQKETNARMDAMREEFLAMMTANREEFLAMMTANREEFLAMLRETNARMDANQRETNARIDANRKEIFKVQLLGAVILAVLLMSSPLAGKVLGKFGLAATPSAVRQDVAPPRAEEVLVATDSPAGGVVKHHLPPPARLRRADSPRERGEWNMPASPLNRERGEFQFDTAKNML